MAGALDAALYILGAVLPAASSAIQSAAAPVSVAAESALTPLASTLTLTVNVQPDRPGAPSGAAAASGAGDGQYKVSALRVAAAGSTVELYLATASAGPAVFYRPGRS